MKWDICTVYGDCIIGGVYKAVLEAEEMGARAFGLFLRSQRQWASKPLADVDAQKFRDTCKVCFVK